MGLGRSDGFSLYLLLYILRWGSRKRRSGELIGPLLPKKVWRFSWQCPFGTTIPKKTPYLEPHDEAVMSRMTGCESKERKWNSKVSPWRISIVAEVAWREKRRARDRCETKKIDSTLLLCEDA